MLVGMLGFCFLLLWIFFPLIYTQPACWRLFGLLLTGYSTAIYTKFMSKDLHAWSFSLYAGGIFTLFSIIFFWRVGRLVGRFDLGDLRLREERDIDIIYEKEYLRDSKKGRS